VLCLSFIHRITDGPDKGAWYHPQFLRGKPSSLCLIKRTAVKKNTTDRELAKPEAAPNFYVMPPIEVDSPDEAMSALGVNYPLHPRDRDDWLFRMGASTSGGQDNFKIADEGGLIAAGVLHQKLASEHAETPLHPMVDLSMSSCNYQNADLQLIPAPTMLRTSATNICYRLPCFNSFGHTGQLNQTHNACVPLKSEEQGLNFFDELAYGDQELKQPAHSSRGMCQLNQTHNACVPLKSEEQELNLDELANGDQELKQPTVSSRLQTMMPNSNLNVVESNTCSETDDLVTKAFQYAFRDMPPRHVSNITEDNGTT
jgi:hypothetical protein